MPIPKPYKSESESEYINRCMSDETMRTEYESEKQRYAVCRVKFTDAKRDRFERTLAEKTFTDYPKGISEEAERGIRLNKEVNNKCATQVGKVRARQLANREPISLSVVKRMYSYLSRASEYYDPKDTTACGTISYLLWGGEPALRWSERILKQEERNE